MAGSMVELEESRVEIEKNMKDNGREIRGSLVIVNGDWGYNSKIKDLDLKGKLYHTANGDSLMAVNGELKGKGESFSVDGGGTDGKIEEEEESVNSVEGRLIVDNFEQEKGVIVDIEEKRNASGLGLNGDSSMVENGELKVESKEIEGEEGLFVEESSNGDDSKEEKRQYVDLVEERSNGNNYEDVKVDLEEEQNIIGMNGGDSSAVENGELMPENKEIAGKVNIVVEEKGEEGGRGEEYEVDVDTTSKVEEIEKEDNLVVEEEKKEMGMSDKVLGSSEAEESRDMQALIVKEEVIQEKEAVLLRVEEQEVEVVIAESESHPEMESGVDKEYIKGPESSSRENKEHKVVDDEKGDVGSIIVEESQKPVDDSEATENVAELKLDVEAELNQEPRNEKTINVEELESSVEVEHKRELDTTVEETHTSAELEIVVEEAITKAELEPDAEIELKQDSDTVVEENGKDEAEEKMDLKVAVEADDNRLAIKVEPEQAKDVAYDHVPLEKVEVILNSDGDALTNEPSHQLENVSTNSAVEISGYSLEDESNDEAIKIQFGSFEVPLMLHVAGKELVEKINYSTNDKNVEVEVVNGETVPSEFNTDISFEAKVDSECMVSSTERDQSTNKDDDKEPNCKVTQVAKMIQAPPEVRVVKKQFVYMIKVPRFIDDELQKEIRRAKSIVDEKTQIRDSISEEKREQLGIIKESSLYYSAELAKEKDVWAAVMLKRQELEKVEAKINKLNYVNSIADIDEKIRYMKYQQQHETISLKQEKQYIQEINRMIHLREQLSLKQSPQEQNGEPLNPRDEIEAQLKKLKNELEPLKAALSSAKSSRKSSWNKHMDEQQRLDSLKEKHNTADGVRQEAYQQLTKLRNQSAEMARHFQNYKFARSSADNYKFSGDNQGLKSHCSSQVEEFFDLWNNDKEFRDQYAKSNTYSTLKRLETLDGRSLGPGEERPIFRPYGDKSLSKTEPAPVSASEVSRGNLTEPSTTKHVAMTNQSAKMKSSTKPPLVEGDVHTVSISRKSNEEEEREKRRKKGEEEMSRKTEEFARKEEELRKEKAAVELKERLRLEQRAKAREAEDRKRRVAERAQARAEYRLQTEVELKEKKKARKDKKKAGLAANTAEEDTKVPNTSISDTNPPQTSQDPKTLPRLASKRSTRPASFTRQHNRVQAPFPLPLCNRSKRRRKTWMWALLVILLVFVVFLAGNYISFLTPGPPNFGF